MASRPSITLPPQTIAISVLALAIGAGVAWLDSSPTWDDAGVTAALLVLGAALVGALDGRRPWWWAVLVGGPLALIEVPASGSAAPLVALVFAAVGAGLGIVARYLLRTGSQAT